MQKTQSIENAFNEQLCYWQIIFEEYWLVPKLDLSNTYQHAYSCMQYDNQKITLQNISTAGIFNSRSYLSNFHSLDGSQKYQENDFRFAPSGIKTTRWKELTGEKLNLRKLREKIVTLYRKKNLTLCKKKSLIKNILLYFPSFSILNRFVLTFNFIHVSLAV